MAQVSTASGSFPDLSRGVQEAAGGSLRFRKSDFGGTLEPDRQISGHEEPEKTGLIQFSWCENKLFKVT